MKEEKQTILLASDHAGFELKTAIHQYLLDVGYTVQDMGPYTNNPNDDYTNTILPLVKKMSEDKQDQYLGIVFGGSGQGEAIVANRFKNVRATVYYGGSEEVLVLGREHNHANILSLGARFLTLDEAQRAVIYWLESSESLEERHVRRVAKLDHL